MEKNKLLETFLGLLPRTVEIGAKTPEDIVSEKCAELLAKLPEIFDYKYVRKHHPVIYSNSMNTVLI